MARLTLRFPLAPSGRRARRSFGDALPALAREVTVTNPDRLLPAGAVAGPNDEPAATTRPADRHGSQPPAAAPRRPWTSRLSAGHLVMLTAALAAVLVNYSVLRARDDTVRVAVAAEALRAGTPVTPGSFAFVDVRAADSLVATLLTPDAVPGVDGWVPTGAVEAGELVRASDLRAPSAPAAQRAMSLPVDPAHAVAGALEPGDRVDVIEVLDGTARYLVTDAAVLAVGDVAPGGLQGLSGFSVTLAVDDQAALRLARAVHNGALDVVRSTGAKAARPGSASTPPDAGAPRRDGGPAHAPTDTGPAHAPTDADADAAAGGSRPPP